MFTEIRLWIYSCVANHNHNLTKTGAQEIKSWPGYLLSVATVQPTKLSSDDRGCVPSIFLRAGTTSASFSRTQCGEQNVTFHLTDKAFPVIPKLLCSTTNEWACSVKPPACSAVHIHHMQAQHMIVAAVTEDWALPGSIKAPCRKLAAFALRVYDLWSHEALLL